MTLLKEFVDIFMRKKKYVKPTLDLGERISRQNATVKDINFVGLILTLTINYYSPKFNQFFNRKQIYLFINIFKGEMHGPLGRLSIAISNILLVLY